MGIAISRSQLALAVGLLLISLSAGATSLAIRATLLTQANAARLGFQVYIRRYTDKTSSCDIWVRVPPQVNAAVWFRENPKDGSNEVYIPIALTKLAPEPALQKSNDAFDTFIDKGFYGVHITVPYADAMKGQLSFSKSVGPGIPVAGWVITDLSGWLDRASEHR